MKKEIEIIFNFRKVLLSRIETLTIDQLNVIPANFKNNIIWNLAHMNSVFQSLCYKNSELPITMNEIYFSPFLPGTKPLKFINEEAVNAIKEQSTISIMQFVKDIDAGLFSTYKKAEKIEMVYNIKVETISDAIKYVLHHDGIHFNAITTLKRIIEQ